MLENLDVAKVLIEAFDNDETGILLYDKKDKLCFANKPMFTKYLRFFKTIFLIWVWKKWLPKLLRYTTTMI